MLQMKKKKRRIKMSIVGFLDDAFGAVRGSVRFAREVGETAMNKGLNETVEKAGRVLREGSDVVNARSGLKRIMKQKGVSRSDAATSAIQKNLDVLSNAQSAGINSLSDASSMKRLGIDPGASIGDAYGALSKSVYDNNYMTTGAKALTLGTGVAAGKAGYDLSIGRL